MNSDWQVTACPYDCPCTCSMKARMVGGKVEIVPNRENHSTSFICAKGLRFRERVFDPRRIKEPLLRDGAGWKAVSWEDAWSIWADRVQSAVSDFGSLSLMYFAGAGSMYFSKALLKNVFAELGDYTTARGSLCSSIGSFGLKASTCGFGVPYLTAEVMDNSKGVMFWGRNVYCTQPQMVRQLDGIRARGGSIASIEVRESVTARRSDRFWRIEPGGDWALAAWLCKKFIDNGACAPNWRSFAVNADDFTAAASKLDSNELLAAAGVTNETAEEIFAWLRDNYPVTHVPSYGAQRYLHGDMQFRWIFALAVICGGFNNPCAGLSFSKDEQALLPPSLLLGCDNVRKFSAGAWGASALSAQPPVRVLHIVGANPARQNPQSAVIREAMAKIPFKVCSEMFMTDTAKLCDLVLPVTTFLEDDHDWIGSYWHSYVVRSSRVVPPVGDAKSDVEIYDGLARALGLKINLIGAYESMDRLLLSDSRLVRAGENLYHWDEPVYWTAPGATALMPTECPEIMNRKSGELRLVSVHTNGYINGQSLDAPGLPDMPLIFVSEVFAKSAGLSGGELVAVRSESGSCVMRAVIEAGLGAATAVTDQGIAGINELTASYEAPGGGAAYADCFVRVEKL